MKANAGEVYTVYNQYLKRYTACRYCCCRTFISGGGADIQTGRCQPCHEIFTAGCNRSDYHLHRFIPCTVSYFKCFNQLVDCIYGSVKRRNVTTVIH